MTIKYDGTGMAWLEPKHIDLRTLAQSVEAVGIAACTKKYALSLVEWQEAAKEMASLYRKGASMPTGDDIINAAVNNILSQYALSFPPYGTAAEVREVQKCLNATPPNLIEAQRIIFSAVMDPRIRAIQLVGRFMKLPPFDEFAYLIDAAALSFYRGNIPSAFMTLLPVIEGVLLRWQGFPGTRVKKPKFKETIRFIADSADRQPMPLLPLFFDSWVQTVKTIMKDHLYRDTGTGPSFDAFNRHLALHLLEDQKFCTNENVTRAFLLVDLLSELYICEKRIKDPRWKTKREEEDPHTKAYRDALMTQTFPNQPEKILTKTHNKCR
jgi:hypothetical protein